MKIQIHFLFKKNFRSIFNKNTDLFSEKNSNIYLIKIQIYFLFRKILKSVFNENTYLILFRKKF